MEIKMKSQRQGNWIGLALVYPNGTVDTVVMAAMPPDNDWRATIEFYDELVRIYRKRLNKMF
jgi:hypothetical protein